MSRDIACTYAPFLSSFSRLAMQTAGAYVILCIGYEDIAVLRVNGNSVRDRDIFLCAIAYESGAYHFFSSHVDDAVRYGVGSRVIITLCCIVENGIAVNCHIGKS